MDIVKHTDFWNSIAPTSMSNKYLVDLGMFYTGLNNQHILCLGMVQSYQGNYLNKNYFSRKSKQQYC